MSLHHRLPSLRLALLFALAWAGLAPPARAGDADQYLPADSMLVIKINVRQLLNSRLAGLLGGGHAWQYRQNVDYDEMQAFYKDIGFDPFKDLDRVILAGSAGDAPRKGLAILRGRFDPAKIRARWTTQQVPAQHGRGISNARRQGRRLPNLSSLSGDRPVRCLSSCLTRRPCSYPMTRMSSSTR